MKQHYMTKDERQQLEALYTAGIPVAQIARQLGFCRQTIYNEIKRGLYVHTCKWWDEVRYSAQKGQQKHDYQQTAKGRPLKIGHDHAYAQRLENLILGKQPNGKIDRRKRYSPAAALAQARREGYETTVCTTTLYSYIYKNVFLHLTTKSLWEKNRPKKQKREEVRRIAHPALPSIEDRPGYVNSREEPGHIEIDLIVSCEKGSGALLTVTERAGRYECIRKLPDKKAATVRKALQSIRRSMPEIKSVTADNGPEFLEYEKLHAVVKCPVYYCHSYAAWEKGANENHNRMIRRWFPKGTDFSKVKSRDIAECQEWMNDYPRKSLGWITPREFYQQWAV